MQLQKIIKHGEMIPPWYGVSWIRYDSDVAVCFPVPLNVICAFARGVYIWARHGHQAIAQSPRAAYAQGFKDGQKHAAKRSE